MDGGVLFDTHDLQTFDPATNVGIITNVIDHTSAPDLLAQIYTLADTSGSSIPTLNYPSKKLRLTGAIKGSTQANLDSRIDEFKGWFVGKDKNLDVTYGSGVRRYIATPLMLPVIRQDKPLFATFTVDLICTLPFGLDTSTTDLWAAKNNFTSATFTETPTILGTAPYQLPVITITIDALTGAGDYVQISNDNNNQEILIYGQGLVATDVLVIDCVNKVVTLNGSEIDYYGTFLELEPGASSITYTDGFTTRTVDVSAVYTKRWL